LKNAKTQISIHNLSLDSYVPIGEGELKQEVGNVIMQQLQIHSSEQLPIQMEQVNLVGKHYAIHQDYLTMAMTVNVQRVHQGTESYGPGIGELELQHWHLPSLLHVGKTLFQVSPWSKFAPEQLFKFMPEGLVLLQNTPILTIKPFQLLTAEGEIQGQLDAKMEPFNAMLALLNPMLILNALTGELDMSIPSALVSATKENTIWQTDINRPGYAHTRLQIRQGMVDINGEKTPLTTWFSKN
jgi:uncharacterized protein YdgA (DUF945 family)